MPWKKKPKPISTEDKTTEGAMSCEDENPEPISAKDSTKKTEGAIPYKDEIPILRFLFEKSRCADTREGIGLLKEANKMLKVIKHRLDPDVREAFELRLQQLTVQARELHNTKGIWPKFLYFYLVNPGQLKRESFRLREDIYFSSNTLDSPETTPRNPQFSFVERPPSPDVDADEGIELQGVEHTLPAMSRPVSFSEGLPVMADDTVLVAKPFNEVNQSRAIQMLNTLFKQRSGDAINTSDETGPSHLPNQGSGIEASRYPIGLGYGKEEEETDETLDSFVTASEFSDSDSEPASPRAS